MKNKTINIKESILLTGENTAAPSSPGTGFGWVHGPAGLLAYANKMEDALADEAPA